MTGDSMDRLAVYIALGQRGDRTGARAGLEELWAQSTDANPATRCGIAHSLADVQDEPRAELVWDLTALTSALEASNDDVAQLGMSQGTAGLMPSLHLNLADVYRRLGQSDVARGHALQALRALGDVEANHYFSTIAQATERVIDKLDRGIVE